MLRGGNLLKQAVGYLGTCCVAETPVKQVVDTLGTRCETKTP